MDLPAAITPAEFYSDTNVIFEGYNAYPNFLTYLVNGNQHCFTNKELYYTADAISAEDNGQSTSQEMMYQWVNNFPLAPGQSETTVCEGTLQLSQNFTGSDDKTYCSKSLASKKYTQK